MYPYNTEKLLQSLVLDSATYEAEEEWNKLDNVINLYKWVKNNSEDGIVYLNEEQRDVYLCGECNDTRYYETAVDNY